MPKIDKQIIDKILETAKIEEVIQDCLGSYGSGNRAGLKKTGVRYKALCPFHDDRSLGSFIVYPKGNCYKCFSCGAKGGVVEFLMEHEKLSYPDPLEYGSPKCACCQEPTVVSGRISQGGWNVSSTSTAVM